MKESSKDASMRKREKEEKKIERESRLEWCIELFVYFLFVYSLCIGRAIKPFIWLVFTSARIQWRHFQMTKCGAHLFAWSQFITIIKRLIALISFVLFLAHINIPYYLRVWYKSHTAHTHMCVVWCDVMWWSHETTQKMHQHAMQIREILQTDFANSKVHPGLEFWHSTPNSKFAIRTIEMHCFMAIPLESPVPCRVRAYTMV